MGQIEIKDDRARLIICPGLGGGIISYEALHEDGTATPLLRSWKPSAGEHPFSLACNLLIPWSNRISGGGFSYQERFYPLEANVAGQKYPIHGNAFLLPWTVSHRSKTSVLLEIHDVLIGPFDYAASVLYELRDGALKMSLTVNNQGEKTIPYGIGFHPWFPRHPETCLRAAASSVWHEDAEHLPTYKAPISNLSDWDFSQSKPLPKDWINNCFTGWNHKAEIIQPEDGLSLSLTASETLGTYVLYSPSGQADFFCFEPVSHVVNAHNLKGNNGLVPLMPGESLCGTVLLDWSKTFKQCHQRSEKYLIHT